MVRLGSPQVFGNLSWFGITPKFELLLDRTKVEEKTEENIYDSPIIKDNNIKFEVTCDGRLYFVNLQSSDKINFKAEIICDNKKVGNCNLVLFSNEKSILLKGNWIEEDEYSCIVELYKK